MKQSSKSFSRSLTQIFCTFLATQRLECLFLSFPTRLKWALVDIPLNYYLLVVAFVEYKATSTEIQFLPGNVEILT
jgi:hypothetical protein